MLDRSRWEPHTCLYTFSCSEEELGLCFLEQRVLFGVEMEAKILQTSTIIDPSRSPFIKERLDVIFIENELESLLVKIRQLPDLQASFKVKMVPYRKHLGIEKIAYEDRRRIERQIGLAIPGQADLHDPDIIFGILKREDHWVFGYYLEGDNVWFRHQQKPHQYSTALNTRIARAIVNLAAPDPKGKKVIDPCCGIGTVLVEALSMGVDIVGSDNNPLVMKGARANIAHFGLHGQVFLRDIREVTGQFDSAIIDMPYNLCSVISEQEKLEILLNARRFTERMVLITIEPMDDIIYEAGFQIIDRCEVLKSHFKREIIICN